MIKEYTLMVSNKEISCCSIFVILMLMSLLPWPVYFYVSANIRLFLQILLSIIAYFISPGSFYITRNKISISILLIIAAMLGTSGNMLGFLGSFLRCIPFVVFICARSEMHIKTINIFNTVFCWILGISLVFWVLFLFGVPLPHSQLGFNNDDSYFFNNYYLFLQRINNLEDFFPRFCSIFLEPGYIACLIVVFLFMERFDFRRTKNLIYVVALIMTFSLAGWIIFLVAFIPFVSRRGQSQWIYIILLSTVVGLFLFYNNSTESNVVNEMIGNRIKIENGEIIGYNRANEALKNYWNNHFWKGENRLMGLREAYLSQFDFGASVDVRAYVIRYGLLAIVVYLWFLTRCMRAYRSRYAFWIFFIIVIFVFRGYSIMFTDALLFIYLGGLERMRYDSTNNRVKVIVK